MLQQAACRKWKCWKGDASAAHEKDLCEAVQAPNKSATSFGSLVTDWCNQRLSGIHQCENILSFADPCCCILLNHGAVNDIMSRHVDDCIFVGEENDAVWLEAKASVPECFRCGV